MQTWIRIFVWMTLSLGPHWLYAQADADSLKSKQSLSKKAFKQGMRYITTSKRDTIVNESSVDINAAYQGKIIRNIYIHHIGFERSVYDTTKRTKKIFADV